MNQCVGSILYQTHQHFFIWFLQWPPFKRLNHSKNRGHQWQRLLSKAGTDGSVEQERLRSFLCFSSTYRHESCGYSRSFQLFLCKQLAWNHPEAVIFLFLFTPSPVGSGLKHCKCHVNDRFVEEKTIDKRGWWPLFSTEQCRKDEKCGSCFVVTHTL